MADPLHPLPGQEPTPPGSSESTGLPPNVAAGLACIFPLVGGIVFLILEKRSAFVRFYAMQSICFAVASIVFYVALKIAALIFRHMPVLSAIMGIFLGLAWLAFSVLWLVIYIVQIVKAFSGVEWEIPYLGSFARRQITLLKR